MTQPQTQQKQVTLYDTAVQIDPIAIAYNVLSSDIQQFVEAYLSKKGIEGIIGARSHVVRDGNQRPEVEIYLFFNMHSPEILSGMKDVAPHLRDRMDVGGFRASDNLFKALRPIVSREVKLIPKTSQKVVYVKLDEFRVLGMMLAADSRFHQIAISEVRNLGKKRSVWTVFKANRFVDKDDSTYDRLLDIIERDRD